MQKNAYFIFHANLAFSSIEVEQLPQVIDQTYFPLLKMLETHPSIKVGIEINGYSLELVAKLRPSWIEQFIDLHVKGQVELVGSGYMQIIGPLVPYIVNVQNQRIGLAVYQKVLGIRPKLAYVNEQTISSSMIDVYSEVGYSAIVMEWNNLFSANMSDWQKNYSFQPVHIRGLESSLPLIWTDTILFQQFQRTAHFEQSIEDYLDFLDNYLEPEHNCVPIYTSDLEVFNFRPGRFDTETALLKNEWLRIYEIIKYLKKFKFILPSQTLVALNSQFVLNPFSSSKPIFVKKQDKYSLSRWAACGRDANLINTLCCRFYSELSENSSADEWKSLLFFWGSDFRTHITLKKWRFVLHAIGKKILSSYQPDTITEQFFNQVPVKCLKECDNRLVIERENIQITFIKNKGFCLDSINYKGKKHPVGTVHHGEFSNISYVADLYTGSCVIESAITGKVTDLVLPSYFDVRENKAGQMLLNAHIPMKDLGFLKKVWTIDFQNNFIRFHAELLLNKFVYGSIRLGSFTMKTVDDHVWYETHNGGQKFERFFLKDQINQHSAKSILQSSHSGLGATEGEIRFGSYFDPDFEVNLKIEQVLSRPFVMLQSYSEKNHRLNRIFFSVQEIDDTLKENNEKINRVFYTSWGFNFFCDKMH